MTIPNRATELAQWAKYQMIDCQLGGADDQALRFQDVAEILNLFLAQTQLIAKYEEVLAAQKAEIVRLETLAFYR